jgi:serine protease Do
MKLVHLIAGRVCGVAFAAMVAVATIAVPARADDMTFNESQLVRSLLPMVVNITAHAEVAEENPMMASANGGSSASQANASFQIKTSAGSGFIIDPSGLIATNWHVVDGAYEILVTFSNGERARADVENAAPIIDLALLKVNVGHPLPAITWGDSSKVQIGDPVIAIGNPLGVGMSVSSGIVSALNRNIMDTPYDNFIQTDAAINHGNSGGPLFNAKGEVIGVNTALISTTSANAGLGFALPANDAHFVLERLRHREWGRPAFLGVKVQAVTPEMAEALGLSEPRGSIVAWVTDGGPAAKAGIRPGDIIVTFAGQTPSDDRALLRAIATSTPGADVKVGILRDGQQIEIPVKLGEWPAVQWEARNGFVRASAPHIAVPPDLGLTVTQLSDAEKAQREIPADAQGALVTGVKQGTDAARRGITPGDVLIQIGDQPVHTAGEVQQAIDKIRAAHRAFGMFLILPKNKPASSALAPGPRWFALRVSAEEPN